MNELEAFLARTEDEPGDIHIHTQLSQIQYPFIYVDGVTNVELRYWKSSGVLKGTMSTDNDVGIYLKQDTFKLLGYITMCTNTFKVLSALYPRLLWFKRSKDDVVRVTDGILTYFLLGG
ncbi:MAG: hypothetical protein RSC43_00380 [Clostridia bacterium]